MAAEPVEVARNEWGAVLHHEALRTLELRWFATTADMGDEGFKETLELLAGECERFRPASVLVDSMEFLHRMGEGVNEWRDEDRPPLQRGGCRQVRVPRAGRGSGDGRVRGHPGGGRPGELPDRLVLGPRAGRGLAGGGLRGGFAGPEKMETAGARGLQRFPWRTLRVRASAVKPELATCHSFWRGTRSR